MSLRKAAKPKAAVVQPKVQGSKLELASDAYSRLCARFWYQQHAERIAASKKLLGLGFYRGDCHIHSNYSDGRATVAQIKEAVDAAGLDFVFVTDHYTTDQKYECKKFQRIWWGQEPGAGLHHLGILGVEKTFEPSGDFLKDFASMNKSSTVLPFVPHPAGWFPKTRYTAGQIKLLDKMPDLFHMEIINGANQFFDTWDVTDAKSVELWDKLLCQGKIVYAMGNSDAHMVHGIGAVWNGVFSNRCNKPAIIEALRRGHYFVSEAPLINISAPRAVMGQTVHPRKGTTLTFHIASADTAGIEQLRLIKNGRIIKSVPGRGRKVLRLAHRERFGGRCFYLRAEVSAVDSRRAFTNPIFVGY